MGNPPRCHPCPQHRLQHRSLHPHAGSLLPLPDHRWRSNQRTYRPIWNLIDRFRHTARSAADSPAKKTLPGGLCRNPAGMRVLTTHGGWRMWELPRRGGLRTARPMMSACIGKDILMSDRTAGCREEAAAHPCCHWCGFMMDCPALWSGHLGMECRMMVEAPGQRHQSRFSQLSV